MSREVWSRRYNHNRGGAGGGTGRTTLTCCSTETSRGVLDLDNQRDSSPSRQATLRAQRWRRGEVHPGARAHTGVPGESPRIVVVGGRARQDAATPSSAPDDVGQASACAPVSTGAGAQARPTQSGLKLAGDGADELGRGAAAAAHEAGAGFDDRGNCTANSPGVVR